MTNYSVAREAYLTYYHMDSLYKNSKDADDLRTLKSAYDDFRMKLVACSAKEKLDLKRELENKKP